METFIGAEVSTETTGLLRSGERSITQDKNNGTFHDREAGGESSDAESGGVDNGSDGRDGVPEMAKKMHILIPAVGIGVRTIPSS